MEAYMERLHAAQRRTLRNLRSPGAPAGGAGAAATGGADTTTAEGEGEDQDQGEGNWLEAVAQEEELQGDPEELSYDELLDLGERLGDVRKERWREQSHRVICALRVARFGDVQANPASFVPGLVFRDTMCVICQFTFEAADDVKLMPACPHSFHTDCVDAWLRDNDRCAMCKTSVVVPGMGVESSDSSD